MEGGEGGTQGIKVAHFYVCLPLCTHSNTTLQGNNMCAWTHTESGETTVISLSNCGANSWWPGQNEKRHTSALNSNSRCIPACQWCNPQWVTSLIMCLWLQKCQLRREGYISIGRLFKKLSFKPGWQHAFQSQAHPGLKLRIVHQLWGAGWVLMCSVCKLTKR